MSLVFDHEKRRVYPSVLKRQGRVYRITTVSLHHCFRQGRTLIHVFSASDGNTFWRIQLNTDTLHWELTEVYHE